MSFQEAGCYGLKRLQLKIHVSRYFSIKVLFLLDAFSLYRLLRAIFVGSLEGCVL
jgi:hypothetical protein